VEKEKVIHTNLYIKNGKVCIVNPEIGLGIDIDINDKDVTDALGINDFNIVVEHFLREEKTKNG